MERLKIAFCWHWDRASEIKPKWRDGLRAAIEVIEKKHKVEWFLDKQRPNPKDKWDFILFWDDSNSEFFNYLGEYNCRKGICLTTSPHNIDNLKMLDVVFAESKPVVDAVRRNGIRAIHAFGTDTEYFKPNDNYYKDIDYFYPATFSPWKRQSEIAYLGPALLCVGTIQPDGLDEYNACIENKVQVKVGYYPVHKIRTYYNKAKNVIIPAVHGSERTVLEAMSMNILPIVLHPKENAKTYSYIEEYQESGTNTPREFVLKNYSHFVYVDALLKGIEQW